MKKCPQKCMIFGLMKKNKVYWFEQNEEFDREFVVGFMRPGSSPSRIII